MLCVSVLVWCCRQRDADPGRGAVREGGGPREDLVRGGGPRVRSHPAGSDQHPQRVGQTPARPGTPSTHHTIIKHCPR